MDENMQNNTNMPQESKGLSIASMVLTTESLVTDAPEKKCECGHSDNGMGAGMDGMY